MVVPPKARRALSQTRLQTPTRTWGSERLSALLEKALDVGGLPESTARGLTHGFHSYPARMHPLIARRVLHEFGLAPGDLIVDPFCGSGTVLVEALRRGARAIGGDLNPLAVEIAWVRTWLPTESTLQKLVETAKAISKAAIDEGKAARRAGATTKRRLGPWAKWFDPHVAPELQWLLGRVDDESDPELKRALRVLLSSILVKVSRRASDTSGENVARSIGRGMAARLFAARAEELAGQMAALAKAVPPETPAPMIRVSDARKCDAMTREAKCIVSSPPYAGTYDYLDNHALRMDFLGLTTGPLAKGEIGARRSFQEGAALTTWEKDFGAALAAMSRTLRKDGEAVLLIGDSLAGTGESAVAVRAIETIRLLASTAGLRLVAGASQVRPALGLAEQRLFVAGEPKEEHLVLLRKIT